MGAPRGSRAEPALVPDRTRRSGQAAAVLDFAVAQILPDDTALGALPAVLERLVAAFGIRGMRGEHRSGLTRGRLEGQRGPQPERRHQPLQHRGQRAQRGVIPQDLRHGEVKDGGR